MLHMALGKAVKLVTLGVSPKYGKIAIRIASSSTVETGKLIDVQENKERDLVNFPRPERAEYPGVVRFGFIPDEWFTFLYGKIGVTGPYTLAIGTASFFVSKEIYVLEHNFFNGISMAISTTYLVKKFGPRVAANADKEIEKIKQRLQEFRQKAIIQYEEAIVEEKLEQWRYEGQLLMLDAKKKLVAMQLEADYRERAMAAYNEVKRRLECEIEQDRIWRNLNHKHMVMWVSHEVDRLVDSTNLNELVLKQCIEQLLSIAPNNSQASKSGGPGPTSIISRISYSGLWITHLLIHCAIIPYPHDHLSLLRQKAKRVFPMIVLHV